MNIGLIVIIAILVARFAVDLVADLLNLGSISEELPDEFDGWYDEAKYQTSQRYLRETTRFGLLVDSVELGVTVVFIATEGAFHGAITMAQ